MTKWHASPYIDGNYFFEVEADDKEDLLDQLDEIRRDEVRIEFELHEVKE